MARAGLPPRGVDHRAIEQSDQIGLNGRAHRASTLDPLGGDPQLSPPPANLLAGCQHTTKWDRGRPDEGERGAALCSVRRQPLVGMAAAGDRRRGCRCCLPPASRRTRPRRRKRRCIRPPPNKEGSNPAHVTFPRAGLMRDPSAKIINNNNLLNWLL